MSAAKTQAVARRSPPSLPANAADLDVTQVADAFVKSGWFKDVGDQAQAVVKILAGREMGLGPMVSMVGINIIEGKPALSANLLASQVKRHPVYDYIPREVSDQGAKIEFFQNGEPIGVSEFTMADATRAGIAGKSNFKRYPKAMLFARALSQGVRWYCPDVTAGAPAYVPEELGAEVNAENEVIEAPIEPAAEPDASEAPEEAEAVDGEVVDGLDPERTLELEKGIASLGLGFGRLKLLLGSAGVDAPKINRPDSIRKAIRAMSEEQAERFEGLLNQEADRAS